MIPSGAVRPYAELPGFEHLLLEESWVLDIEAHPGRLTVQLDLVLTPEHPEYAPPVVGEQFCYRTGAVSFRGVEQFAWTGQGIQPARDATGEIDFGHIDEFDWGTDGFRLTGDFGTIDLQARTVSVELETDSESRSKPQDPAR